MRSKTDIVNGNGPLTAGRSVLKGGGSFMSHDTHRSNATGMGPELQATDRLGTGSTAIRFESGISDLEVRFRKALVLWLRWNEAYELATAQLFSPGQNAQNIEAFMDKMDDLRSKAISLSHKLLD
jgi:hypothetical protein